MEEINRFVVLAQSGDEIAKGVRASIVDLGLPSDGGPRQKGACLNS